MPAVQGVPNSSEESVAFLKEVENLKNSTLSSGEIWFLVGVHWYRKMTDYLHGNADQPGPIDNSDIIEQTSSPTSPRLKDGLQDELDYVLVPERAWNMLRDKFDLTPGQGTISRKVIDMGVFVKHKTVEVYPLELQLSVYSNEQSSLPVTFSRMATPNEVKKEARTRFQLGSAAQLRLYQKLENDAYHLITDDKCHTPLSDLCFVNRQNVVIDVEENGQWHITQTEEVGAPSTDQTIELPLVGPSGRGVASGSSVVSGGEAPSIVGRGMGNFNNPAQYTPGLCGLTNLGNTCFMNSALQCMSNAGPLVDYFVADTYKTEINETNPLGMHGEIAQTFGDLCKQIWSGRHSSVVPRAFKLTVGRFAPQFSGYQQQDSQELMAFLLDGLHEDLNRIREKPYIEIKDSYGQPDESVAAEAWTNYKKRNDSVIVDLFHGLLKSTVVCPECNKVSVTFDPFCYLSLPLPSKKDRQIMVNFVPLDHQKPILKCKVTVPKNGTVRDLVDAVGRLVGTNPLQLVVCEVYSNRVYKLIDNTVTLSQVMDRDDVYIYEVNEIGEREQPVAVVFYNRVEKKSYFSHFQPQPQWSLVGLPMVVAIPKNNLTHQNLKEVAEKAFKRFVTLPAPGEVWWRSESDSDSGVEENGDAGAPEQDGSMDVEEGTTTSDEVPQLFVMRVVNSQGTTVFEEIRPGQAPSMAEHTSGEVYVALDWHPVAAEKYLDIDETNFVKEHESVQETKVAKKALNLDECLDLFTTTEKLGEHDLWYCPRCKKHQQATKKFDLWSLPEILIIHLKRFSYTRFWRDKIETFIDYPLRDLDPTKWVINGGHPTSVYDLIAVSNHYGGLGGGHYTAYAKNKRTGRWYSFDDSNVSQIGEEDVVTKSGYVLVYQRRRSAATIDASTDPNVEMEDGEE